MVQMLDVGEQRFKKEIKLIGGGEVVLYVEECYQILLFFPIVVS